MNENYKDFNIIDAYKLISTKLTTWVESAIVMLPNLAISILVVIIFAIIGRLLRKLTHNLLGKVTFNESLRNLISSIVFITVISIGAFIALSILNLDGVVTSLLAGAGILGLALGFAFQEIASNYIAGTVMSINKPFELGDLIKTNDFLGTVMMIHLRTTHIQTLEGQVVTIPNAEIFKKPYINYSTLQKRRIDLTVGVSYNQDLEVAKEVALNAIKNIKDINKEEISIFYQEFNDSSIDFTVRYWINFSNKQFEYLRKIDEGIIAIKKAFDTAGITIPFPIKTLDFGEMDLKEILQGSSAKKR